MAPGDELKPLGLFAGEGPGAREASATRITVVLIDFALLRLVDFASDIVRPPARALLCCTIVGSSPTPGAFLPLSVR